MNSFNQLPYEIINLITRGLPLGDLIRFSRTCSYIYDASLYSINSVTDLKKSVNSEIKKVNYSIGNRDAKFIHGNDYSLRISGSKYTAYFSREYYSYWSPMRGYGLTQDYDSSLCVLSNELKMTADWLPVNETSMYNIALPDFKFGLDPEGNNRRGPFGDDYIYKSEDNRYVCIRGMKYKKSKVTSLEEFISAIYIDIYLLDESLDVCVIHVGIPEHHSRFHWGHNSGYKH